MKLRDVISKYGKLAVAFSGGVDSSTLAVFAAKVLGRDKVLCLHASSILVPENEQRLVNDIAKVHNLKLQIVQTDPLAENNIVKNDSLRCYHCKKFLMRQLLSHAARAGFPVLADAVNTDDLNDYRPGIKACDELKIVHPLLEAKMNKNDVRALAAELQLPNSQMPAGACLASRIAYGMELEASMLKTIDRCEQFLRKLDFTCVRARFYAPQMLRLEVSKNEISRLESMRHEIGDFLSSIGIKNFEIDPRGYRQGSLNEL